MTELLLSHAIGVLGFVLAMLATVHMLARRRTPQSASAWLVILFAFPWIGVPLYLVLGGRKMRRLVDAKRGLELGPSGAGHAPFDDFDATLRALGIPPAEGGHALRLHEDGREAFAELVALIDGARYRIDYSTFILAEDAAGRAMMARLVAQASAGVEVRLLLDAVGSLRLRDGFTEPLPEAGGRIAWFMPILHRPFRGRTNLRNHRKIVIADDGRVWTGGRNGADAYPSTGVGDAPWIDLSCTVEGPAVRVFRSVLAFDWRFATGELG